VILGATNKQQLLDNLGSLDILSKLTDDVMKEIEEIVKTKPVLPEY
jgi:aryl-alcohol dehydrogenase-like predicted oxidoreductase